MSQPIRKEHNVSILLYHLVCPAKYRRVVMVESVDSVLRDICLEIAARYEITFLEIGVADDHVHFLVQSVPSYSPTKVVRIIKSLTAREVFRRVSHVKRQLWGGEFWTDGYYISTVGQHGSEDQIRQYVARQGHGKTYTKLYAQQLRLFKAVA